MAKGTVPPAKETGQIDVGTLYREIGIKIRGTGREAFADILLRSKGQWVSIEVKTTLNGVLDRPIPKAGNLTGAQKVVYPALNSGNWEFGDISLWDWPIHTRSD
ncbi:MAG: hypothetical protein IPK73_07975 [Candidatus Obscuribacter sp.]|mgnify:FL=1|nr:hypothetical protein [Candidatus Obscuribacter sp.]MBK9279538.1 hypothetical protein [Candidatus Obscuribacter sp.]